MSTINGDVKADNKNKDKETDKNKDKEASTANSTGTGSQYVSNSKDDSKDDTAKPDSTKTNQGVGAILEKKLQRRPSKTEVMDKNILKKGGTLSGPMAALEKKQLTLSLRDKLDSRPGLEDIKRQVHADSSNVAPKLQSTAKQLEFKLKCDSLNRQIHNRRSSSELKRDDPELFPDSHIAPSLRPASRQLQHELKKNKLNQLLQTRPTPTELVDAGIVKPQISSRIKGVAKVLEHKQRTDKLGHLLEQRPEISELKKKGIILPEESKLAPSIQEATRQLKFQLRKDNFHYTYANRKKLTDLVTEGVVDPENYAEYLSDLEGLSAGDGAVGVGIAHDNEGDDADDLVESKFKNNDQANAAVGRTNSTALLGVVYQKKSKEFHQTRILLKFVALMAEKEEISQPAKGYLKDMIVDQNSKILGIAEEFDNDGDVERLKEALILLCEEPTAAE
mmetsp:Transcript_16661/g.29887  ORF Transcript_16661/g.29887 Transcript_16661/m.29887 type:complete len:449 (-) Transcript_16661:174-1520(-)|eukprot:CAMPEP_0197526556 /NCGR_PEP_ID=MMETSP1318-20131121/18205_1 /TAXON_ID=552666 /ORGANISM="Partenskyella glossopodia, Strain RCC365" /LENGTH=448 /DNA_ID=CAMNT_0043080763 /DNA_START=53 /DNA_END=1399 /DNA_ORIENTATION=-